MLPFQDECDNSSQDIHWKRGEPDQCITITSVTPTSAPANQQEQVTLNVQAQLPQVSFPTAIMSHVYRNFHASHSQVFFNFFRIFSF